MDGSAEVKDSIYKTSIVNYFEFPGWTLQFWFNSASGILTNMVDSSVGDVPRLDNLLFVVLGCVRGSNGQFEPVLVY